MRRYKGIPVSSGVAIGVAHLYLEDAFSIPKYDIDDIEFENYRLEKAIKKTKDEIKTIQNALAEDLADDKQQLYKSLIMIIEDEVFLDMIKNELYNTKKNIEYVLYIVLNEIISKFKNISDQYLSQRSEDISSLGKRLMRNLMKKDHPSLDSLNEPAIIISRSLSPTDAALINKDFILGLTTEIGGEASHSAIMARALSIPAVLGIEFITSELKNGELLIINGTTGEIIVNPDEKTLEEAKKEQALYDKHEKEMAKYIDVESITKDGKEITVLSNIEIMKELDLVRKNKAKGIGLFRSEFLILETNSFPDEDYQYKEYKKIFNAFKPEDQITIRTLDLGGDKVIPGYSSPFEKNPFLGWRAIRFCLDRIEIFKDQLRAILRAAADHKNLEIMIPMIATLEEIKESKRILREVEKELDEKGIKHNKDYKFGIMVEIPAAVVSARDFAKEVDFFSIGTNDLIQYLLACDRGNEKVAYLFRYSNPTVLKTIKNVIDDGHEEKIKVSMCGEMASDIHSIPILLGMGLTTFSVPPKYITIVKKIVSSTTYKECKELYENVAELNLCDDIHNVVDKWLHKKFSEFFINR